MLRDRKTWLILFAMMLTFISLIIVGHTFVTLPPAEVDEGEVVSGKRDVRQVLNFAYLSSGTGSEMKQVVDRYNEIQSEVRVEMLSISPGRYSEMLNMLMASGKGPDLLTIHHEWITTYMNKNWLLDLTPYVDKEFLNNYPKFAQEYGRSNGNYYTFPTRSVTTRLLYNKTMFRQAGLDPNKPPMTLEELVKSADLIARSQVGTQKRGFALAGGEDWKGFVQSMETANTLSGSYLFDFSNGTYDLTIYKPWLHSMMSMVKQESLFPGETSLKYDTALTQFTEGNIAMMIVNSGDLSVLQRGQPLSFEWGASMPPAVDADHAGRGALMMHPEPSIAINSSTEHTNEAINFWRYLHEERQLGEMFQMSCIPSIVKGINDNPLYKPALPDCEAFMPGTLDSFYPRDPVWQDDYGTVRPYDDPNAGWTPRMQVYRDILSGKADMNVALKNESDRLNNQLQRAVSDYRLDPASYLNPNFNPRLPLNR
ncbi:ABC transporter substrate-binding protein [Paenibacillus sp. GCM10023252]|uniref:ABC transporter substrate-binding protein n=1 Tax=Paenibacillus sp. GCM10023252 TaxID=3252649 RepID=UPI0036172909